MLCNLPLMSFLRFSSCWGGCYCCCCCRPWRSRFPSLPSSLGVPALSEVGEVALKWPIWHHSVHKARKYNRKEESRNHHPSNLLDVIWTSYFARIFFFFLKIGRCLYFSSPSLWGLTLLNVVFFPAKKRSMVLLGRFEPPTPWLRAERSDHYTTELALSAALVY